MDLRKVIGSDCPIVTINHMTPFHDKYDSPYVIDFIKKMTKGTFMITNSYEAAKQWGWGYPVIHGMDVDEWWDLPKEPRCVTVLSPVGMERAYRRIFLRTVIKKLAEMKVPFVWVGPDKQCASFKEYREFLGRSLVFFMPTWQSPMPRARTEALLCLKPGSKVIIGDDFSFKEIKDMKAGDTVIDRNGRKVKVIQIHNKDYNGDFCKISVYGHEPMECSNEHKFLAIKTSKFIDKYRNGTICKPNGRERDKYIKRDFNSLKPEWIEAGEIKKGDCILSPSNFEVDEKKYIRISDYVRDEKIVKRDGYIRWKGCHNNLPEVCKEQGHSYAHIKKCLRENRYPGEKSKKFLTYLQSGGYKDIGFYKNNTKITPELARFIGYYIAEGYVLGSMIRLCFNSNETEYHNDIVWLVKKLFNISAKIIEEENNKTEVVFSNQLIAKLLEKICGKGARNKIIPAELVNSNNKEMIINLLAGLYRGDGHIGNEANYCSISDRLVYQIYFLLKRIGIHGTIVKTEIYSDRMRFDRYSVRSYGTYRDVLREIVDKIKFVDIKHKNHSYFNYKGNWYYMVRDVKKSNYKRKVYDLTVTGNNYLVNGLVTHNSGCCVVSTPYQDADTFIKHGVNGFLTSRAAIKDPRTMDNPEATARLIKRLVIDEPDLALKIGQEGKKMARKLFCFKNFENQWLKVIEKIGIRL